MSPYYYFKHRARNVSCHCSNNVNSFEMMASVEVDAGELTAAEATQYDRQIRLWGVDAQKKYVAMLHII
jgi:thiaminase